MKSKALSAFAAPRYSETSSRPANSRAARNAGVMKTRMRPLWFGVTAAAALAVLPAQAQLEVGGDLMDECARIQELVEGEDYTAARRAARDCLEALEQRFDGEIAALFPQQVAGWSRSSFEQNKAMGFSNTTAEYRRGDQRVDVSLTGGSSMNALGSFAAMGMMGAGKQVRVAGLQAIVSNDGKILVSLENGSLLNFESRAFKTGEAALEGMGDLVDAFPVAELNAALKAGS